MEDGSLAIGILAALVLTWIAAVLLSTAALDQIGWLLLALLVTVVVLNVRRAGYSARRKAP